MRNVFVRLRKNFICKKGIEQSLRLQKMNFVRLMIRPAASWASKSMQKQM